MKINYNKIRIFIMCYSLTPILIFFFGWLKNGYAFLFSMCMLGAVYCYIRSLKKEKQFLEIKKSTLIITILLVCIFSIFTGVGGYVAQNIDFSWRTAIFRDLIEYDWPVYYPKTDSLLAYYFLFWLPAALVGKLVGIEIAQFFLWLYFAIGILLICLVIAQNTKTNLSSLILIVISVFSFGMLEFFSGTVFSFIFPDFEMPYRFIFSGHALQIVNNQVSLSFIYNQTVIPWLMLLLIVTDKKISSFALCGGISFIFSPFSVIGLVFYTFGYLIVKVVETVRKKKNFIRKIIGEVTSICNILATIAIVPVFSMFYLKIGINSHESEGKMFAWMYEGAENEVFVYLLFYYIFAVAIYAVGLYKFEKKNVFFYISFCLLIVFPHVRITMSALADFVAHASPVVTFYVMYMCVKNIINKEKGIVYRKSYLLIIIAMSLATINYQAELWYIIRDMSTYESINPVSDRVFTLSDKVDEVNFLIQDPGDNLFFKTIGRDYR